MKTLILGLTSLFATFIFAQESGGVIEVTGMSSVELTPDYLDIQVVIDRQGEKALDVQKEIMKESQNLLAYLMDQSDVERVRTERVTLYPRQNNVTGKTTYSGRQTLSFRIVDLDTYDRIIPEILSLGVNGISNFSFGYSKLHELTAKLDREALQNALEKATYMAAALGQEIGKAVYISDGSPQINPMPRAYAMDASLSSRAPSIEGGVMKVSREVRVHFELK